MATAEGLIRFDGQHYHTALNGDFRAVAVTTDGIVWAGGATGLFRYDQGKVERVMASEIRSIAARGREVIVNSAGNLWKRSPAGLEPMNIEVNGPLSGGADGRIWFGCGRQLCAVRPDGAIDRMAPNDNEPWITGIGKDGRVWGAGASGLSFFRPDGSRDFNASPQASTKFYDFKSGIWRDLSYFSGNFYNAYALPKAGLSDVSMAEDCDGHIWFASRNQGLYVRSPKSWIEFWMPPRFFGEAQSVTRTPSGRLLVSGTKGIWELNASGRFDQLPGEYSQDEVVTATEGSHGDMWVVFRNVGVKHFDRVGRELSPVFRGDTKHLSFRQLFRDRHGTIWVGAKAGLYRIDEVHSRLEQVPLPNGQAYAAHIVRDPEGQEWLGHHGGISRLENGTWNEMVPASALAAPGIRNIAVGPGPVFWVTYRFTTPPSMIWRDKSGWRRRDFNELGTDNYGLLRDHRGWIWRGTNNGLFVSDGVHLEPADWIRFDQIQNLPDASVHLFGLFEDQNGTVWIGTPNGVARITPDPEWFIRGQQPVRLTRIGWNGGENLWPARGFRLPSDAHNVQLDFAYWPKPTPSARPVQYRLIPKDPTWHTAKDGSVRFDSLEPTTYRVEMRMDEGAPVEAFEFAVPWTAPGWVWPVGGIGLGGIAIWAWQFIQRARFKAEYQKKKDEFTVERAPETPERNRSGELLAGRYELQTIIGRGGFSTVFRGRNITTDDAVAVKCLQAQDEIPQWQKRRFEKETEALRRIHHPGVVRLLDAGWLSEREPFLVMSLAQGRSLEQVLHNGPIPRERAAKWIAEIGVALAAVHAEGVLHRDLKPDNILICDEDEHVVVVDFGAAAIQTTGADAVSSITLGALAYMAPERVQGRSSTASDVYSMAAIAFEMCTGVRYSSLADGTEAGLRAALTSLPREAVELLAQGLNYEPTNRPACIRTFGLSLAAAISGK